MIKIVHDRTKVFNKSSSVYFAYPYRNLVGKSNTNQTECATSLWCFLQRKFICYLPLKNLFIIDQSHKCFISNYLEECLTAYITVQ